MSDQHETPSRELQLERMLKLCLHEWPELDRGNVYISADSAKRWSEIRRECLDLLGRDSLPPMIWEVEYRTPEGDWGMETMRGTRGAVIDAVTARGDVAAKIRPA